LPALFHDGLGDAHFAVVVVEQRTVFFNATDADNAVVEFELTDKIERRLTDNATVTRAHFTAGNNHPEVFFRAENGRHMQVVGDHLQTTVLQQCPRNGFGGGADIDKQTGVIRNLLGNQLRNALFSTVVENLPILIGQVFGRIHRAGAAMKAGNQAGICQQG